MTSTAAPVASVGVTICIPSFNRADLIRETLDSILAQTSPHWEALIVDDGSTDDSLDVIAEYSKRDARVRMLKRDRLPKGACTCRNIAVENARKNCVMFLDTDDILAPFCVQQRLEAIEKEKAADFVIFPMLLFQTDVSKASHFWNVENGQDDLLRVLRLDPICQGTGTLWRADSFKRLGGWNEDLKIWQDIELHVRAFTANLRFMKRFDLSPDVYLRESVGSLSRGDYQSRDKLESRASVVRLALGSVRRAGKPEMIREIRFLCSSVIFGAATAGHLDIASELRSWAAREGVLTGDEISRLRFAEFTRSSRFDHFAPVRRIRDALMRVFVIEPTLGKVAFTSVVHQTRPGSVTALNPS